MGQERFGLKIGFSNVVTIGDLDKFWWSIEGKILIKVVKENVRGTSGYGGVKKLVISLCKIKDWKYSQNKHFKALEIEQCLTRNWEVCILEKLQELLVKAEISVWSPCLGKISSPLLHQFVWSARIIVF